jgi:hypothetical protein
MLADQIFRMQIRIRGRIRPYRHKFCVIFVNLLLKIVFKYIYLKNLLNASKVFLQSYDVHLKFVN